MFSTPKLKLKLNALRVMFNIFAPDHTTYQSNQLAGLKMSQAISAKALFDNGVDHHSNMFYDPNSRTNTDQAWGHLDSPSIANPSGMYYASNTNSFFNNNTNLSVCFYTRALPSKYERGIGKKNMPVQFMGLWGTQKDDAFELNGIRVYEEKTEQEKRAEPDTGIYSRIHEVAPHGPDALRALLVAELCYRQIPTLVGILVEENKEWADSLSDKDTEQEFNQRFPSLVIS